MHAAPLFDPIDDLTGAVPTWRLDEQPEYDQLVAEWPALYARLCAPVDEPGVDVVEGEVLEGPPTVVLSIVTTPTQPLDLPLDCDDCEARAGEPCRTPSGRKRLSNHASRTRTAATA